MQNHDEELWSIAKLSKGHYAEQIFHFFTKHINNGKLIPHQRLPSYRVLAEKFGVHRNTISNVYRRLERADWIYIKLADGTFVSETFPGYKNHRKSAKKLKRLPIKLNIEERIKCERARNKTDFTVIGFDVPSPKYFPVTLHYDFMYKHVKRYKNLTQMGQVIDFQGLEFKKAIFQHLNTLRNFSIRSSCLDIVVGREESLERVLKTVLTPGDMVINTSPKDTLLCGILRKCKVRCHEMDSFEGNFIENISNFLRHVKVKAIYIRPQCSYPASQTLGALEAEQLIELAKQHGFYIIEEDDYHEFWYRRKPFKELVRYDHHGHVIYLGALSLLSPYMQQTRTIVAAEDFITLMKSLRIQNYNQRDVLTEKTITDLLNSKKIWKYILRMKEGVEVHMDQAWVAMDNYLRQGVKIVRPASGLTLWLQFITEENLQEAMNLILNSGQKIPYHPDGHLPGDGVCFIRLGVGSWNIMEAQNAVKLLQDKFQNDYGKGSTIKSAIA
jgi:GntR family transcriptional regulator/MocR family aminotransferase